MEIHLSQILFQIINFGVVFGALTVLLYKPILKVLDTRAKKIEEAQKAADDILKEKSEIEETKRKVATQLKKESAEQLTEAKDQASAKKKELEKVAKKEVEEYIEQQKKAWEKEKAQLKKDMEKDFNQAVFAVVEKVLKGGAIDQKQAGKLIDSSIQEVLKAI